MAISKTKLDEKIRATYLEKIIEFFKNDGEEVLRVKSNEISIPCVDDEGNEKFVNFTVKVPKGEMKYAKEAYDGYAEAENYEMEAKAKAEKTAEAERKKLAKIEKDKALREAAKRKKESEEKGD